MRGSNSNNETRMEEVKNRLPQKKLPRAFSKPRSLEAVEIQHRSLPPGTTAELVVWPRPDQRWAHYRPAPLYQNQ